MPLGHPINNQFLIQVTDRFRDLRFTARQIRELSRHERVLPGAPPRQLSEAISAMADVSEGVLSNTEKLMLRLLSSDPQAHAGQAPAYGFERYVAPPGRSPVRGDDDERAYLFARDQHVMAKRVMNMLELPNSHMHRERYLELWAALRPDFNLVTERAVAEPDTRLLNRQHALRLAAGVTAAHARLELILHPEFIRRPEDDLPLASNRYMAVVSGLLSAVASVCDEPMESTELYAGCIAAGFACHEEVLDILEQPDFRERLPQFYDRVVDTLC